MRQMEANQKKEKEGKEMKRMILHILLFAICYSLAALVNLEAITAGLFIGHWMAKAIFLEEKYKAEAKRQVLVDASIRGEYP